jgi:hypothetical protein
MFYASPDGDDEGPGTRAEPWGTLGHALAQLAPGHTLVLLDGEYSFDTTGVIALACSSGTMNGTASSPIRVIAQTERRAFLRGDGDRPAISVYECSHWRIEGLRAESRDREGVTDNDQIVSVVDSSNITLRRLLASRTNRMLNGQAVYVYRTSDPTIEELELYDFHDAGLLVHTCDRARVRRTIVASRGYPLVVVGDPLYPSGTATVDGHFPDTGHGGVHLTASSDSFIENVVVAGGYGFVSYTWSRSEGNVFAGNVALGTAYGFLAGHDAAGGPMGRYTYENDVVIGPRHAGFFQRGQQETTVRSATVVDGESSGYSFDDPYEPMSDASTSCIHCLSTRNAGTGYSIREQVDWEVRSSTSFGDDREYLDESGVVDPVNLDPELGGCLVYLPEGSPLRGAGADGADIGANVLYRYRDGLEIDQPLWDREGRFPCFGVVDGVNDDEATSCIGIHERLEVGTDDCPLPPGLHDPAL